MINQPVSYKEQTLEVITTMLDALLISNTRRNHEILLATIKKAMQMLEALSRCDELSEIEKQKTYEEIIKYAQNRKNEIIAQASHCLGA